jgi:hypothetical protein
MEWLLPRMTRYKPPTIGKPPTPFVTVILACFVRRPFLFITRHATQYLIRTSQLYYKHTLTFRKKGGKQMNLCIKAKLYNLKVTRTMQIYSLPISSLPVCHVNSHNIHPTISL